jgi:predicted kinase
MRMELLMGLPGSGKSYYAREKAKKGYIVLDIDHVSNMTNGGIYDFKENRRALYGDLLNAMVEVAIEKHNIIIDTTNLVGLIRRLYIARYGDEHEVIGVYWPPKPKINLHNRMLESRGYSRDYWKRVIDDMAGRFEPPSIEEGFDHLYLKEVKKYGKK